MLTDKDREWLEKRAVESCDACKTPRRLCTLCCRHQKYGAGLRDWFSLSGLNLFVFTDEYRDAAEFEARVAAKLAEHAGDIALTLQQAELDQLEADKMLRAARFAVEKEMEAEYAG